MSCQNAPEKEQKDKNSNTLSLLLIAMPAHNKSTSEKMELSQNTEKITRTHPKYATDHSKLLKFPPVPYANKKS